MRVVVAVVGLVIGCVQSQSLVCEVGTDFERTCPEGNVCDDAHHLCVLPEQLDDCAGMPDREPCAIVDVAGLCHDGVCLPATCGDGFAADDEVCDGSDFADPTKLNCTDLGYYEDIALECNSACAFDLAKCRGYCGDGIVTLAKEQCDGAPPASVCTDFGFGAGFVECGFCVPELSDCKFFGWRTPKLTLTGLRDIGGTSDSDVYAVGDNSLALHWNGVAWSPLDLAACAITDPENTFFLDVETVAPGDVWIAAQIASDGVSLHLTPQGCDKKIVGAFPEALSVTAANEAWIVSLTGTYRYNGSAWSMVDASAARYVYASGPNDVYVSNGGTVLRRWNGSSFQTVTLPGTPSIFSLYGTSADDVYVGGATPSNASEVLRWNGSTWQSLMAASPVVMGRVQSISKGNGRIFTTSKLGGAEPTIRAFDGTTWADLDVPPVQGQLSTVYATPTGGAFYMVEFASQIHRYEGSIRFDESASFPGGDRFTGTTGNRAFVLSGSGVHSWQFDHWDTELSDNNIRDLWIDPTTGVLYYLSQATGGVFGGIGHRVGSSMWVNDDLTISGARFWGSSATDFWVVDSATQQVLRRWTGGPGFATCTPQMNCMSPFPIGDLWGASASSVFAVGAGGMIRHWDGQSWSEMVSGVSTSASVTAVYGWSADDVVAVSSDGVVVHYNGQAWTSMGFPTPGVLLTNVWGTSNADIFVAGQDGLLFHYDGTHWAPVATAASGFITSMGGAGDSVFMFEVTSSQSVQYSRFVRTSTW